MLLRVSVRFNKDQQDFRPDMDDIAGRLTFAQITNDTKLSNEIVNAELEFLDKAGETFYNEDRYTN